MHYQKREQELLNQLSVPLDSRIQDLLQQLKASHEDLLHQQLAQLRRTYLQQLPSANPIIVLSQPDDNTTTTPTSPAMSQVEADASRMLHIVMTQEGADITQNMTRGNVETSAQVGNPIDDLGVKENTENNITGMSDRPNIKLQMTSPEGTTVSFKSEHLQAEADGTILVQEHVVEHAYDVDSSQEILQQHATGNHQVLQVQETDHHQVLEAQETGHHQVLEVQETGHHQVLEVQETGHHQVLEVQETGHHQVLEAQETGHHQVLEVQETGHHQVLEAQETGHHQVLEAQETGHHQVLEAQETVHHQVLEVQETGHHQVLEAQETDSQEVLDTHLKFDINREDEVESPPTKRKKTV